MCESDEPDLRFSERLILAADQGFTRSVVIGTTGVSGFMLSEYFAAQHIEEPTHAATSTEVVSSSICLIKGKQDLAVNDPDCRPNASSGWTGDIIANIKHNGSGAEALAVHGVSGVVGLLVLAITAKEIREQATHVRRKIQDR